MEDDNSLIRNMKVPQKRKEAPKKRNLASITKSESDTLRPDTHTVRFYCFAY